MTKIEDHIRTEIEMWAKVGHPALMQKFILNEGRLFENPVAAKKFGKQKECFKNAFHYAQDEEVEYVEGYILLPNIPILIHHAWCCEFGDTVPIETTIKDFEGIQYFGFEFDYETIVAYLIKHGVYGIIDPGFGLNIDLFKRYGMEISDG